MEHHREQLLKHCRVCGRRLCKAKGKAQPVYKCTEDLQILGVDIGSGDGEDIFPTHFCNPCHAMVNRAKKAGEDGVPYRSISPMEWTPHGPDCQVKVKYIHKYTSSWQVCLHFEKVSRGGGQNRKQTKNRGRQSGETPKAVIDHIKAIAPPSLLPKEDPHPQYNEMQFSQKLTCPLCSRILNQPVECSIVCSECCCKRIQNTYSLSCPSCSDHMINSSTVQPP